jgi:hypothetical protein
MLINFVDFDIAVGNDNQLKHWVMVVDQMVYSRMEHSMKMFEKLQD